MPFDKLAWQREHREETYNAYTKKYEKTKKGFLMRLYRNMQSRVTGVQKKKAHLYLGVGLLDRGEFYSWALSNEDFHNMFKKWEESKYDRKLCPTVDRIDSSKGYFLPNMEWVTHSENSRRGANNIKRKRLMYFYKGNTGILVRGKKQASKMLGISTGSIGNLLDGTRESVKGWRNFSI